MSTLDTGCPLAESREGTFLSQRAACWLRAAAVGRSGRGGGGSFGDVVGFRHDAEKAFDGADGARVNALAHCLPDLAGVDADALSHGLL